MKILYVRQSLILQRYFVISEIEVIRSLNKLNHPAYLIGIATQNQNREKFIELLNAPFKRASLFQLKTFFYLPYFILAKKIKFLIVDYKTVFSTSLIILIKAFYKVKIILDIRTIPVEKSPTKRFNYSLKFANKFFNGASFITEGTKKLIEEQLNLKFKNYVIYTSGVNLDNFTLRNDFEYHADVLEKTKNKFVLFYHGSISPNRGVNLILDALNKLKTQIPNLLFVSLSDNNKFIVGYCNQKKYDLEENLLLIDSVENKYVPYYITLADFCIVPLPRIIWWEVSSPLKLMEYLAMEKPIILTNIKAHIDVVSPDSKYAIYFNPDDEGDLEKKMMEAYMNKIEYQKYAYKGRELVASQYTWDHQAEKLVNFFQQI